jgi:hypothetical protein
MHCVSMCVYPFPDSLSLLAAMTNSVARRPGLVKCDKIYIRASKFSDKNTTCIYIYIIRGLLTFWIPNFGLVHFKIICQALFSNSMSFYTTLSESSQELLLLQFVLGTTCRSTNTLSEWLVCWSNDPVLHWRGEMINTSYWSVSDMVHKHLTLCAYNDRSI